jgi:hypothetical protein
MSTAAASTGPSSRGKPAAGGLTLPITGAVGAVLLIVIGVLLGGRRDEQLPTIYGRRRGGEAARSVNGTAVLADLFRRRGHSVTTLSRFSPRLEKYDVVVWVPNDFEPPDEEHREFLEDWLRNGSGRTVVYVGRDYNAAIDYWERMAPSAPPEKAGESLHRQAEARAAWEATRSQMPSQEYARWFTVRRDEKPRKVEELSGPWAEGIDPKQTNIHLEGQLVLPPYGDVDTLDDLFLHHDMETLLRSGSDALVFRMTNETDDDTDWNGGQIIVLTNGSFVLNYPLVNHEHRKLADKLIQQCGSEGRKVVLIESDAGGPKIVSKEPTGGMPTALELLKVWPLNAVLLHVAVLGIVVCLSRSPIFGRPRELPADSPSDFGKHVAALGKLLSQTKDRNYAHARLAQYRQIAERRSGRSHLRNK